MKFEDFINKVEDLNRIAEQQNITTLPYTFKPVDNCFEIKNQKINVVSELIYIFLNMGLIVFQTDKNVWQVIEKDLDTGEWRLGHRK